MATVTVDPDEVRALYGADVTTDQAPNTFVNRDAYAGRAVREVKRRAPDWATYTADGDEEKSLNSAANALTAAYSLRAIPNLTGEDEEGIGGYRRQALDVDKRIGELLATAADLIGAVVDADGSERPTAFTLAHGTRGL